MVHAQALRLPRDVLMVRPFHAHRARSNLLFIALLILVHAATLSADEPGDVRGGYFTYHWNSGTFGWEPFLRIAHPKSAPSENGEAEIWGFRPWNLEPPGRDGKTLPVNVLESRFIPCDGRSHTVTISHPLDPDRRVERSIKCPEHLWR
jgi:hypothetical protein